MRRIKRICAAAPRARRETAGVVTGPRPPRVPEPVPLIVTVSSRKLAAETSPAILRAAPASLRSAPGAPVTHAGVGPGHAQCRRGAGATPGHAQCRGGAGVTPAHAQCRRGAGVALGGGTGAAPCTAAGLAGKTSIVRGRWGQAWATFHAAEGGGGKSGGRTRPSAVAGRRGPSACGRMARSPPAAPCTSELPAERRPGSRGMHRGGGPRGLRTRGTSVSHVTLLCASHNGSNVTVGQCMS